ncbi:hypothetical protein [Roseomonas marmotae]|uniref:Uncharacterized protein n=1 Tax=Roseomonas marmotae TaxID=2768161 RepID=A0ABS3KAW5_9PROT|nr:hypothetical protein [Roseomonas marmotae]MBO1073788.1 hypothetical protein [Roseomonas marmotae]QTI78582.1 hypothetical protein IAI58_12980 [Roseomonas marmotae]
MDQRQTGIRVMLQGADDVAVEAAADELKQRLGARFSVVTRKRRREGGDLVITATMLASATANVDAAATDLIDLIYASQAREGREPGQAAARS